MPRHVKAFSPLITRDFQPPKPSPAGILHIAKSWNVTADDSTASKTPASRSLLPILMVGDSIDDMTAGREAGALTVLLRSEGKEDFEEDERTDVVIDR